MKTEISIVSAVSLSALGTIKDEIWKAYLTDKSYIKQTKLNDKPTFVAQIPDSLQAEIEQLKTENDRYKNLDPSVLFAIFTARKAVEKAGWKHQNFGVNFGSSRGATQLFEEHHQYFLEHKKAKPLASPTTTLGNISSWVAHDLQTKGPEISHSITCSTALHALLNGIAWLESGFVNYFLIGGSEAPLTPFTIAQMEALKIYATENDTYICKSLDLNKKKNTMVLGEGAASICLEKGKKSNALAIIEGIGFATEILNHNISISEEAICFQKSMKMALENIDYQDVDVVVMHAPGTIQGDLSEYKAIQNVFGEKLPMLTTNKWKIGHTFGASGLLSLELALLMLKNNQCIDTPFYKNIQQKNINKVLVNAVGFGGNAVSVLISKNNLIKD